MPDKEFKVVIIKILPGMERRVGEPSKNFNKDIENIKKDQSELKKTVTEMKNAPEGINSRLADAEE